MYEKMYSIATDGMKSARRPLDSLSGIRKLVPKNQEPIGFHLAPRERSTMLSPTPFPLGLEEPMISATTVNFSKRRASKPTA